jgi:hypothetical protein
MSGIPGKRDLGEQRKWTKRIILDKIGPISGNLKREELGLALGFKS